MAYNVWCAIKSNQTKPLKKEPSPQWQASEISRPVHLPQQQYLINWKWCHNTPGEVVECYRQVIEYMEILSLR